jgi:hypothetical protein
MSSSNVNSLGIGISNSGLQGAQGPPGQPGVGISTITVAMDGELEFTMTDNTTQNVVIPAIDFDTLAPLNLQNTTNSTSAFSVAESGGTVLLNVNTTAGT